MDDFLINERKLKLQSTALEASEKMKLKREHYANKLKKPEKSSSADTQQSSSNSISSNVANDESKTATNSSVLPKNKRNRKRNKKPEAQQELNTKPSIEEPSPASKLDAESELIVKLLSMHYTKREDFLLKRAEEKKLVFYDKSKRKHSFEEQVLGMAEKNQHPRKLNTKQILSFEDKVNAILLEGISEEHIKKFEFFFDHQKRDPKSREMYINETVFISSLEKHAEFCAKQNLGEIIEGEIRISNCNNHHAFITSLVPNGKRDAMITSKLARKFALHGDIVKCFVRYQGKF